MRQLNPDHAIDALDERLGNANFQEPDAFWPAMAGILSITRQQRGANLASLHAQQDHALSRLQRLRAAPERTMQSGRRSLETASSRVDADISEKVSMRRHPLLIRPAAY